MRVARIVPDVAGIEAEFDYLIPEKFNALVRVGTIVRVVLHGRRIRGWVIDDNATPPANVRLLEIQKVTGQGPPREIIELDKWAAWRWASKRSFFLNTASPQRAVSAVNPPPLVEVTVGGAMVEVVRQPPAQSPLTDVLAASIGGPVLLITPSQRSVEGWVRRLRAENKTVATYPEEWKQAADGVAQYVVGTRSAVWAPMPNLGSIIVLDAHDDALQSEGAPTWSAVDIAIERASRRKVPCYLHSPTPRVEHLRGHALRTLPPVEERKGWAPLHVVDTRNSDPHAGMYSQPVVAALRSDKHVVCVLNRKGRARLLVCSNCDEIARCEKCSGAQMMTEHSMTCLLCKTEQPVVCTKCGSGKFKQLRPGVSRVREELEALAQRTVGEVTGESDSLPHNDVIVGTEAVLHRVSRADVVIFLDFDNELLAPRYRASEDALILLARASRLVRGHTGLVVVQTRNPEHEVIKAAVNSNPALFTEVETERRRLMNWPPNSVLAQATGTSAADYVAKLEDVSVLHLDEKTWLIQATNHQQLCDALARVKRPASGTLRIHVDPPRV